MVFSFVMLPSNKLNPFPCNCSDYVPLNCRGTFEAEIHETVKTRARIVYIGTENRNRSVIEREKLYIVFGVMVSQNTLYQVVALTFLRSALRFGIPKTGGFYI